MKSEKRFPTVVGLIFLIICLAIGVVLSQIKTTVGSRASGDCVPVNPQVTNITHNTVDISFTTMGRCQATLTVGDQTIIDTKSQYDSSASVSTIHYFQVKHLQPKTRYVYSVISSGQTITKENYQFTTSSTPNSQLPTSNLAWGKVFSSDGKTPANAIVYLNIPGAAPLSSFVSTNGNWSISLASSFNDTKTSWFTPPQVGVSEDIIVISDDGQTTQVTGNTSSNNPVGDIIIGTNSFALPTANSTPDQSVGIGSVGTISPAQLQKSLEISNPKAGESITVAKPDFFGTAPINTSVSIYLESSATVSGQTTSDSTGVWHWSPPTDLAPGSHSVTVKVQDPVSKLYSSVSRNYTIMSLGNGGPQYEASSSAKATIAPSPTVAPTNTPTPEPTVRTAHPSVAQPPPITGNTLPTVIIIVSSLIFFVISVNLIK